MAKITLENMEFHAFHGCMEHEQQLGNTFIVSVCMELDTSLAGATDELVHTLNYQLVYDVVKTQMEIPSKLIEQVGQGILQVAELEEKKLDEKLRSLEELGKSGFGFAG